MGCVIVCVVAGVACGKKGPPLPPYVRIPAAVEQIDARRLGDDVYVTLTVPTANVDEFTPADLARVEIYAYTGRTPPPRARWVEFATLIATVPVASPDEPKPGAPPQGAVITVRDTLTAEELVQGRVPNADPRTTNPEQRTEPQNENSEPGTRPSAGSGRPEPVEGRNPEPALRRYYTAYPFSPRGRPGPPGATAELPLEAVPAAPPAVDVTYTEHETTVFWQPSGGLLGFLLEPPDEPPQYNVYRTIAPDPAPPGPAEAVDARWQEQPPAPLNPQPLDALVFSDTIEFGRERCYTVRAVRGLGSGVRIGVPSPAACVTPVDTFPPARPQSLATVASEGAISLIWEPNTEPDLAGYVVLRGDAASATLQPLTPAPIPDAHYRDADVRSGERYVYAVVAVDRRVPVANVSAESDRVEETAR